MASYQPPTEQLPLFDPSVFNVADEALTYNEAVKSFLQFPIAQGTETLQATNINGALQVNSSATFTNTITGTIQKADNITLGNAGDILYQSASNTTAKLPIGANTFVLTSNGSAPTWTAPFVPSTPTLSNVLVSGNNAGSNGINMNSQDITNATAITATTFNGTLNGNASTATSATTSANIAGGVNGDLLYQSAVNTTTKLPIGANTFVLTSNGTTPTWTAPSVVAPTPTLSQVLVAGNTAGASSVNMNNNAISSVSTLGVNSTSTFLDTVSVNITAGGTSKAAINLRDTTSQDYLSIIPNNTSGTLNGIVQPNDTSIVGINSAVDTKNVVLTTHSTTKCGVRITPTTALIGAGGSGGFNPTSSISFAGTSATMTGDLNMGTGSITNATAMTATTFNGALNGNANTATTATTALACSGNSATATTATNALACSGNSATATTATTATDATNASNSVITNSASGTQNWLIMTSNSAGTIPLRTSTTGATYNATTNLANINIGLNAATATTASACSGNSATATLATTASNVALTADNTSGPYLVPFAKALSASEALYVDNTTGPLTYNPSTSTLTATTFSGALNGNANTATTATNANNVNISNTATGTTNYVLLSTGISGNQQVLTDTSGLSYNSTTNTLVANITGNSASTSAVPSAITVNTLTIGTATGVSQPSYGILTQGWNTGGYVSFTGTGGRTITALANEFVAGLGVRIDSWTQTVPPGIASLFEINFTFWNSTAWGQTKYYLQLYPNRLWGQVGTSAFWNMNNAINGTSTYSYTNATYAPNGRWYWTFNQTFSGQAGSYGWFVPHTNYIECYFSIPDNTYSYECNFKCLDATSMTSQNRSWQVYTFSA